MIDFYKKMRQLVTVPSVSILNLIYPPVCGICGKFNSEFLCKKCYIMLKNEADFSIVTNHNFEKRFAEHLYIFKYEGMIRKIILKYKFQDKAYLYKTFVNFLLKNEKFFQILNSYDTIIPVPISKKRQKERGYNQSFLLGKEIAKWTNLKLENHALIKTRNIVEQSKLNKKDRTQNVQGVYELRDIEKNILYNKKLLLLDDIYTTGSTVNECCKILEQAKPKKIGVLTIAKD